MSFPSKLLIILANCFISVRYGLPYFWMLISPKADMMVGCRNGCFVLRNNLYSRQLLIIPANNLPRMVVGLSAEKDNLYLSKIIPKCKFFFYSETLLAIHCTMLVYSEFLGFLLRSQTMARPPLF